ncbi:MAG: FAD:protein FMN transferase [Bacteroidales bacterium]|nr:FAD:protein FMN transferase [Bacteroidales bacterium]MBR0178793.1 FAD:protein FMN transferase [Bacteroidales bacterium]
MKRLAILFGIIVLLTSCNRQPKKIMLQGEAQGSYYAITYYDEQERNFQHEIDSIFHAVDVSVNLWVDTSVISKVNRNEDVTLDSIFVDNFGIAQEAAALSGGYFDPTISPIVAAWGFSYKHGDSITPQLIDSLKQLVDYRKVRIENGMVVKENPAMTLDFNAIAQGYTSDLIASFLDSRGIKNYLVDTGGEIMARGAKPNGQPWIVGIEKPADNWDSEQVVHTRIALRDKGLVTSGSTRKYVERNGKRYSHCIDPNTGYPVEHQVLSVTVMANSSVWADALASICMVMGMEKSLPLIESMDDVEAYYIYVNENNELETFATEGFSVIK